MSSLFLDYRISLVGSPVVNALGTNPEGAGQDRYPAAGSGLRVAKGARLVLIGLGIGLGIALSAFLLEQSILDRRATESITSWWAQQKQEEQQIYQNAGKAVKRTFFGSEYDKPS